MCYEVKFEECGSLDENCPAQAQVFEHLLSSVVPFQRGDVVAFLEEACPWGRAGSFESL